MAISPIYFVVVKRGITPFLQLEGTGNTQGTSISAGEKSDVRGT